jgi:hypothetical protein
MAANIGHKFGFFLVGLADETAGNLNWDFLDRQRASEGAAGDSWLRRDMPQAPSTDKTGS